MLWLRQNWENNQPTPPLGKPLSPPHFKFQFYKWLNALFLPILSVRAFWDAAQNQYLHGETLRVFPTAINTFFSVQTAALTKSGISEKANLTKCCCREVASLAFLLINSRNTIFF